MGVPARISDSPIVALWNGKGGVGKSTLAMALCAYTERTHGSALLVDCDPQGTAWDVTRAMAEPAGYEIRQELEPGDQLGKLKARREYDLIAVDCPGSLAAHMSVMESVLKWSDYVLIPYDHEMTSLAPTIRTARECEDRGVRYAVLVNNVDPRLGGDHLLDAWRTLDGAGLIHLRSAVRRYRAWSTSLRDGIPITRYGGRYAANAREDLAGVMTELLRSI